MPRVNPTVHGFTNFWFLGRHCRRQILKNEIFTGKKIFLLDRSSISLMNLSTVNSLSISTTIKEVVKLDIDKVINIFKKRRKLENAN